MKLIRSIIILAALALMLTPATASAKGVTGERLGYIMLGLKDYDNYNETATSIEVGVNIPLGEVDIRPFFKHESIDAGISDITYNTLALRGDYTLKRFKAFNLYVGAGAGLVYTETATTDEDDLLFQAHVGLDVSPMDNMGLKPECAFVRIGDEDDANCGVLFNLWFNNSFALLAEGRFFLDNRELFYAIGASMTF